MKRAGNHLTQTVGLGLAVFTLASMPDGWPRDGGYGVAAKFVVALGSIYFALALWEFFRPPNQDTLTFRYPRRSGTFHEIRRLEALLAHLRLDRKSRVQRVDAKIADYMSRLLSDASSAHILTRDLSWADAADEELRALAQTNELTIIACGARRRTEKRPNIERYEQIGAQVRATTIRSNIRMTSVEKSGSSIIAIAYRDGRRHIVHEISKREDPVFQLGISLFEALKAVR